jgi:hypothetical protein
MTALQRLPPKERPMNDMQLISPGLTLLAIFAAMYGNRTSVGDMGDVLRAESRADIADLRAEMRRGFESLETKLLVHELEHHRK